MATATLYTQANSGTVQCRSATYLTARSGGGTLGFVDASDKYDRVGQSFATPNYFCWQSFHEFDLSSIPGGSTIDSATLAIRPNAGTPDNNFVIRVRDFDYGTVATADFIAGASLGSTGTLRAHYDTASGYGAAYIDMTDDAMVAAVTAAIGGTLRLVVYSADQEASTTPTANVYAYFGGYASPSSSEELRLTVDYTVSTTRDPMGMSGFFGG